jgi:two-component system, NtrC family, response regulator AtoC
MAEFKIMAVDDEAVILDNIRDYLSDYDIRTFADPLKALEELRTGRFDIIISDYKMPGMNGLDFLCEARKTDSYEYGILLTAYADKELLEDFINTGVIGKVLDKPLNLALLKKAVDEAAVSCRKIREEQTAISHMRLVCEEAFKGIHFLNDTIIGIDGGLAEVFKKAEYIAPTNENVLITGETGTGKEALARTVHFLSKRKERPFIKIHCGAIPESLIESELFGYARGAFSGADRDKPGKIELAHTGTLFLDEIGEVNTDMQTRLLHVVQEKRVERLGSLKSAIIDFRLICATNRDLNQCMKENRFRDDLFYRISTFPIHLPPLRERNADIGPLADYLLKKFGRELDRRDITVARIAMARLKEYSWPGNIREMENTIKRAILQLPRNESVIKADAFDYLFYKAPNSMESHQQAIDVIKDSIVKKEFDLKYVEKEIISHILAHFKGNIMEAVRETGIPKDRFYRSR